MYYSVLGHFQWIHVDADISWNDAVITYCNNVTGLEPWGKWVGPTGGLLGPWYSHPPTIYRLPQGTLQLARMSKVLLAMERGTVSQYKGMTLDDIEIDPEGLGMFLICNLFNTGMVTWCFYKGCTRFCLRDSECCCFNFRLFPTCLVFFARESSTIQQRRFQWHFRRWVYQQWNGTHNGHFCIISTICIINTSTCCYSSYTRLKLTTSSAKRMIIIMSFLLWQGNQCCYEANLSPYRNSHLYIQETFLSCGPTLFNHLHAVKAPFKPLWKTYLRLKMMIIMMALTFQQ